MLCGWWGLHGYLVGAGVRKTVGIIIISSSSSRRPPSTATRCWTFPPPYSYQQPISRRRSTDTRRWTFPAAVFVSPADQPIAVGILSADVRRWTFPAEATKTPHPTSPHLTSPHRRRLTTGISSILPGWRAVSPSPASHTRTHTHARTHACTHTHTRTHTHTYHNLVARPRPTPRRAKTWPLPKRRPLLWGGRSGLVRGLGIGSRTHRRSPPSPIDDRTAVPASIAPRTGDLRFVIHTGRQPDNGAENDGLLVLTV